MLEDLCMVCVQTHDVTLQLFKESSHRHVSRCGRTRRNPNLTLANTISCRKKNIQFCKAHQKEVASSDPDDETIGRIRWSKTVMFSG